SNEKIEYKTGEICYIRTVRGEKVIRRGQIVPQSLREKTKRYFQDLENRGIIRRSRSDWRNPIRAIEKPNGDVRVVSNLMGLNDLVEKDPYGLPTIRDIIQNTQGSNVFTVIDLKEGFYHIEIEEKHKHKTAFEFDGSVYEWNSMVMGFKNAPQIMQRTMNRILDDWRGKGVEVYMD
ncbi:Retrovirus-related Pol polyprotein from transposon gypsy, partial [Nosema granulosis]